MRGFVKTGGLFFYWLAVAYFGREKISLLPCAALFSDFSESKSGKILCVWRIFACLWLKQIIHFHLHPYSPTFRNRKGEQKIFAAQTPPRKRGFLSTHQTIVGETFPHLRNLLSSLADAPHCSMGRVSMHKLVDIILALMPCHVTVCVNFCLGSKVQFLCVITQSTRLAFLPSLPIGKKLGSNVTFMYRKTLCKVVEQCTEYIFVLI